MDQRFNLEFLHTFLVAAETGRLADAAAEVCLSASAVSSQIKRLEEQVGAPLFVRGPKALEITATGERLRAYATRLLELNDATFHALSADGWRGRLTIALPPDYAASFFSAALPRLRDCLSGYDVALMCDRSRRIRELVEAGKVDLGIVAMEPQYGNERLLWTEALAWTHAPARPLDPTMPLPVALFSGDCIMNTLALRCLREWGISFEVVMRSIDMANLADATRCGLAISLLPESLVDAGLEPIPEDILGCPFELEMGLIHREGLDEGTERTVLSALAGWQGR